MAVTICQAAAADGVCRAMLALEECRQEERLAAQRDERLHISGRHEELRRRTLAAEMAVMKAMDAWKETIGE